MTDYDDLFDAAAPEESVFTDKAALDPLADPAEVQARKDEERKLANHLSSLHQGYLPSTVTIYGPPGAGKTLTTRRICEAFAARQEAVAVEYVNCKEARSLFSAANEILFALTGEKLGAYTGLDGVFEAIWSALADYPDWTILLLDEIDQIHHDSNYDPSDFFYRLLRGEGRLRRELNLSVWLISNEVLDVDLRLDSRVKSAMSGEEVFFPPYNYTELKQVLAPRVEQAFREGALSTEVFYQGVRQAARRWGDARKALRLFRQAGEVADERALDEVTPACIEATLEATEQEALIEKLLALPFNHFAVLTAMVARTNGLTDEIIQPVTTAEIQAILQEQDLPGGSETQLGDRAIREVITDLETMDLIKTWIDERGREGRVKQLETAFDPQWVRDAIDPYAEQVVVEEDLDEWVEED